MTQDPQHILVNTLKRLLRRNSRPHLRKIVNRAHPVDLARAFPALSLPQQQNLFGLIRNPESQGILLTELDRDVLQTFTAALPLPNLIHIMERLPEDDVADLVGQLPEDTGQALLKGMKRQQSKDIGDLLRYDEDSAGGIMVPGFIALPESTTVRDAIRQLQKAHSDVEMTFYLYVIGAHERLAGVCSLRELVTAKPEIPLSAIMTREIFTVQADTDQEDVARMVARYDLLAIPVVDTEQRMLGVVTVDDVIDIIREEATEDILKMAGAGDDFVETKSVLSSIRIRLPWLLASCAGGVAATFIIGYFEPTLERLIYLTAFIPVIMGMGGNIGTQSATIVVRGLAMERIQTQRLAPVVLKETAVGGILGFVYGALLGAVAHAGYALWRLGLVVALAVIFTMTLAAGIGALLPMSFARFKIDPAVATGPFVTSAIDILSLTLYFALANLFFSF
jgi:magnesium transporter